MKREELTDGMSVVTPDGVGIFYEDAQLWREDGRLCEPNVVEVCFPTSDPEKGDEAGYYDVAQLTPNAAGER